MFRRVVAALGATVATLALTAVPAAALPSSTPCRPGANSPSCQVWSGKVAWVPDGDTPLVDIAGDGTDTPVSVRLIGVQAMEQHVYHPDPAKRRGECHALAATARLEHLIRQGGGVVRLTAMKASSHSDVRNRPLRSVAVWINGSWYDVGLDLIRNGYALWLPIPQEWAWNPLYRAAAQQAARSGRNMYATAACGTGPYQNAKLAVRVNFDADGDDATNLNGEWIRISNASGLPVPLAGWWVRDSGLRRYTFKAGTSVPAGGSIRVHIGRGRDTATDKYWGLTQPIFANPTFDARAIGDGGYLFDPQGDLRGWDLYPKV